MTVEFADCFDVELKRKRVAKGFGLDNQRMELSLLRQQNLSDRMIGNVGKKSKVCF
jgi:hypothetical protein